MNICLIVVVFEVFPHLSLQTTFFSFLPSSTSFIMSLQSGLLRGLLRRLSIFFSLFGSRGAFLNSGGGGIFGGNGGGIGGGVGFSRPGDLGVGSYKK